MGQIILPRRRALFSGAGNCIAGNDANTILLIHSNTTDESQTFVDSSVAGAGGVGHVLTANNQVKHDDGQKKFGATGIYFDGINDSISTPDSADWDAASVGDYTIDLWVKHTDHAGLEEYVMQYEAATEYWAFRHEDGTGIQFRSRNNAGSLVILSGGEIIDSIWHHVAMTKSGNNYKIFKDGTVVASVVDADQDTKAGSLYIGNHTLAGGNSFFGYMDEIRLSNIARWTANFTPPAFPYCD